eukprot:CAMPEP_0197340372 /NCGR_PEP_ID=MMETSP0892-20130614/45615_1 /TAXON_ID=44058 ORGANISM="Aureoumbra lagunensis, Strain CCMP1510" /NCGR_SAMPLE_ID=MMETSP0892 /ASSEMBLY_ACC=CAM_ASM_000538 /LENGTH=679 /DNA_ID=CAMNT_0042845095 /DNA_START=84 /DNA_END=2124 /DNA_ORIENTATION=-
MAELAGIVIALIDEVVKKYREVKILKKECKEARDIAQSVEEVTLSILETIRQEGAHTLPPGLGTPLNHFRDGLKEINEVLCLCASDKAKDKTKVLIFTKTYSTKLRAAISKIKGGLELLSGSHAATSFEFQNYARKAMERANETLENLPDQIRDIVADEIKAALNNSKISPEPFLDKLVQHNFANDTADAKRQLQELQHERESLLADKLFADKELLEKVCNLSLLDIHEMPPPTPPPSSSKLGQPPSEFICPITRDLMEDPVTLFTESHQSYERTALEKFLDQHPCRDPMTNVDSLEPLIFGTNKHLKSKIELWKAEHVSFLSKPPIDLDIATIARRLGAATDSETRLNMALALHDACDNRDMPNKVTARVCGTIDPLVKMLNNNDGREAEVAAKTLLKLSREDDNQIAIANAGAIQPLIALLSSGTATAKENAATALRNLAFNENNNIAIANAGAIRPLIDLLSSGTATAKEYAAAALKNLAANANNQIAIANAGAIRPLIDLLSSGTATAKENAAGALKNLAVNDNNKIAIANAGAIRPLIALLSSGTATAKEYAAGALRNLAANANNKIAIANAGAIRPLIDFNNIAIANAGAIRPLIALLSSGTATAKENAAAALQNLAANNDNNRIAIANAGAIRPLITLANSGNTTSEVALKILARNNNVKKMIKNNGGSAFL